MLEVVGLESVPGSSRFACMSTGDGHLGSSCPQPPHRTLCGDACAYQKPQDLCIYFWILLVSLSWPVLFAGQHITDPRTPPDAVLLASRPYVPSAATYDTAAAEPTIDSGLLWAFDDPSACPTTRNKSRAGSEQVVGFPFGVVLIVTHGKNTACICSVRIATPKFNVWFALQNTARCSPCGPKPPS